MNGENVDEVRDEEKDGEIKKETEAAGSLLSVLNERKESEGKRKLWRDDKKR